MSLGKRLTVVVSSCVPYLPLFLTACSRDGRSTRSESAAPAFSTAVEYVTAALKEQVSTLMPPDSFSQGDLTLTIDRSKAAARLFYLRGSYASRMLPHAHPTAIVGLRKL